MPSARAKVVLAGDERDIILSIGNAG